VTIGTRNGRGGCQIQDLECDVNTYGSGICGSAGAYILSFGTGKRVAYENTSIMVHEMNCGIWHQNFTDTDIRHEHHKRLNNRIYDIFSKVTKQPKSKIEDMLSRDNWFTAQEAKEFGIVDEVV
jgi:ATP-dependent Clp protease protease subunit